MTLKETLLATILVSLAATCCGKTCDPTRLKDRLFVDYDRFVRPNFDGPPAMIGHRLYLLSINSVDEERGRLSIDIWEEMYWVDDRLSWDPNICSNSAVQTTKSDIWTPQVFPYFGANRPVDKVEGSFININPTGLTGYTADKTMEIFCSFSSSLSIGDNISCNAVLGSWNYGADNVEFEFLDDDGQWNTDYFTDANQKWGLVSTSTSKGTMSFDCCLAPWNFINYTITITKVA